MEAAVQSLKKGKSAGVDNIPAELVQAGGENVIIALTKIRYKIWQTGEWPTPWTQSRKKREKKEEKKKRGKVLFFSLSRAAV